jgi:protein TonB
MSVSLANASRQSIILAAIAGCHIALLVLVATEMGKIILVKAEDPGLVWVKPPPPAPEPRERPVISEPGGYEPPRVPDPILRIPRIDAPTESDVGFERADHAQTGTGPAIPTPDVRPPSLRMRDARLAALVDACYPSAARRLAEVGRVVVRLVVGPDGGATSSSIERSSGFPRLDAAVECVIERLEFNAARRDGRAVEAVILLPIVFRLN